MLLKSDSFVVTATPPGVLWKPTVATYLDYYYFSGRKLYLYNKNTDKVPGSNHDRAMVRFGPLSPGRGQLDWDPIKSTD